MALKSFCFCLNLKRNIEINIDDHTYPRYLIEMFTIEPAQEFHPNRLANRAKADPSQKCHRHSDLGAPRVLL